MVAEWLVAGGTFALAGATYMSVRKAGGHLEIERQRLEAAQWPRVYPAPSAAWIGSTGVYAGEASSRVLPVTNGGAGVALNLQGQMDFTSQGGTIVKLIPTSVAAGHSTDLQLDWPPPPRSNTWSGSGIITTWDKVRGDLYYEDVAGARWLTRFWIEIEGGQGHRRVWVRETEMTQRADGKTLVLPESLTPTAWYTPPPQVPARVARTLASIHHKGRH